MNPQQGNYQNAPTGGTCLNCQNNARPSGARTSSTPAYQSIGRSSFSQPPMQSNDRRGSTYGGDYSTRRSSRAPPVFSSSSNGNFYPTSKTTAYQGQSFPTMRNSGRPSQYNMASNTNNSQSASKQGGQSSEGWQNGPQYCTPQAIKINVTADQLQNAKTAPIFQDRGEPGATQDQGGNGMKYIQLNWQDLLGGMENLRVSMAPTSDASANRQLKVSFGGQKTDPPQAGETPLKVISIQPASTTERMELGKGNAYAGSMKVCKSPTSMRMSPAPAPMPQYRASTGGGCRGTCRR